MQYQVKQDDEFNKYVGLPNPLLRTTSSTFQQQAVLKLKNQVTKLMRTTYHKKEVDMFMRQETKIKQRMRKLLRLRCDAENGYKIASNNIVYTKLNNNCHNRHKDQIHKYGLFLKLSDYNQYQYNPDTTFYSFIKSRNNDLALLCDDSLNKSIIFDSNFESGNLLTAVKISEFSYRLQLQQDINSLGYVQWFYFSVQKLIPAHRYMFRITNMTKPKTLYQQGMSPLVFCDGQWSRRCINVEYYQTDTECDKQYYTLKWEFVMSTKHQKVYFAHSYPYTYKHLLTYLRGLLNNPMVEQQSLSISALNIDIPLITIKGQNNFKKACIVILCRQHPGETPSSYVLQGMVDYFRPQNDYANLLLEHFQFKIVPMVNVDGVILGNYRSGIQGYDMNRKWTQNKDHTIHQIKKLISSIRTKMEIKYIIDLHAHNRKNHSFFYGNIKENLKEARKIPFITSKTNSDIKFQECYFGNKQTSTARVALASFATNNYTFEASFNGRINSNGQIQHYTAEDYRKMGIDIIRSIYQLTNVERPINKKLWMKTIQVLRELDECAPVTNYNPDESDNDSQDNKDIIRDQRLVYHNLLIKANHRYKRQKQENADLKECFKVMNAQNGFNQIQRQYQKNINSKPISKKDVNTNSNFIRRRRLNKREHRSLSIKSWDMNVQYSITCSSFKNLNPIKDYLLKLELKAKEKEQYKTQRQLRSNLLNNNGNKLPVQLLHL